MDNILCWKCNKYLAQERINFCSFCGAFQKEKNFYQILCPVCDINLEIHSRFGALQCLLEIKNKFNITLLIKGDAN